MHSAHGLLERIQAVRDGTDLDLLVFSYRHPHALLTVEHLAAAVGHDRERVEVSLQALIEAGLIERMQNPKLPAHFFAFRLPEGEDMGSLLEIASSRAGRLALLQALQQRALHKRKA